MPQWSDGVERDETFEQEPFNKFLAQHSLWRFESDLMALRFENFRLRSAWLQSQHDKTKAAAQS